MVGLKTWADGRVLYVSTQSTFCGATFLEGPGPDVEAMFVLGEFFQVDTVDRSKREADQRVGEVEMVEETNPLTATNTLAFDHVI